jgi:uncharacterized LabA/DUF88 family protein
MLVNVYVDGFNLYYSCLRNTPYRWLNLHTFCTLLFPQNTIREIKYFTAVVHSESNDPQKQQRQQIYLRALKTIPNIRIIYGNFRSYSVNLPLASPSPKMPSSVDVIKTEEKGSDVNLATHLLIDGFLNRYETAVVVSNDSDLVAPIKAVRDVLKIPVINVNPSKMPGTQLRKAATYIKPVREWALAASQFPNELEDATGLFRKPNVW